MTAAGELPVVLLPVGVDDEALDACLGSLEAGTPAGTRVWLADDAQAGPRGSAIIARWLQRTRLQADYTRRQGAIGEVAHLDEMLKACPGTDVVVLAPDAQPLPGWLQQLGACLARDPAIATATPWCNAGEAAAWPRLGEIAPPPEDFERTARAAALMVPGHPELPSAVSHAVAVRASARRRVGGLDASSYASCYAALIDLSLRLSGLGWRNVLCETAFVARGGEGGPRDGDLDALNGRWPGWNARVANFLMNDPLHDHRTRLASLIRTIGSPEPQRELFPDRADIAVVVVTHQSQSTVDECLARLRVARGVAQVRVIDNASTDASMAIIQRHALADPRVRFLGNPDNPGFSVGCNQGAGESDAPWLAFVNPDLLVEPDTLAQLRALADPLGDCVLGVDLVDETGARDAAARRRDPDFAAMLRAPGAASHLGVAVDPAVTLQPVQAISGALMLMPRALFERLGGLDIGYRLHAEDLDLCRRARDAGATVAVANHLRVLHVRGVSSRARPLFVEWHKHRGLWRYFRKFEAPRRSLVTRMGVWGAIWAHFAVAILKQRW